MSIIEFIFYYVGLNKHNFPIIRVTAVKVGRKILSKRIMKFSKKIIIVTRNETSLNESVKNN